MTQPPDASCEQALDYAYGELPEVERARFQIHLAGCARCREELDGIGQLRDLARDALAVPTAPPLNDLVRAAARRRSRTRSWLFHPGFAAAAGLVVIGGALGLAWTHGRLHMPAATAPAVRVPAAAAPAIGAAPIAEPKTARPEAAPPVADVVAFAGGAGGDERGSQSHTSAGERRMAAPPERHALARSRDEFIGGLKGGAKRERSSAAQGKREPLGANSLGAFTEDEAAPHARKKVKAVPVAAAMDREGMAAPAAAPAPAPAAAPAPAPAPARSQAVRESASEATPVLADGKAAACQPPAKMSDLRVDAAARLAYVRCLRRSGQLDAAERALETLRKERLLPVAQVAAEERALTQARAVRAKAARPAAR